MHFSRLVGAPTSDSDVGCCPDNGHSKLASQCPLSAINDILQRRKERPFRRLRRATQWHSMPGAGAVHHINSDVHHPTFLRSRNSGIIYMTILAQLAADDVLDSAYEWLCRWRRDDSASTTMRVDFSPEHEPLAPRFLGAGALRKTADEKIGEPTHDWLSSTSPTRAITLSQSPALGCLNNRAVGYHGLSSRPVSQRHSPLNGRRIKAGFPIAPARCATAVSTEMTRSRSEITAAVSAKSSNSRPSAATCGRLSRVRKSASRTSRCRLTHLMRDPASNGAKRLNAIERL